MNWRTVTVNECRNGAYTAIETVDSLPEIFARGFESGKKITLGCSKSIGNSISHFFVLRYKGRAHLGSSKQSVSLSH